MTLTKFSLYRRGPLPFIALFLALTLSAMCSVLILTPSTRAFAQAAPAEPTEPAESAETHSPAAGNGVPGLTADARALITDAMAAYRRGEFQNAYKLARSAYMDYFENAEPPLRAVNRDLTLDMEYRFADVRSRMQLRRDPEAIDAAVQDLRAGLIEIDAMFDESGIRLAPVISFSSGLLIALREGLEAALVLGIVIGALRASQSHGLGRYVLGGALLAAAASVALWVALHGFLAAVPATAQVLSAAASVGAVLMLLWVNVWVLRRLDRRLWMETMSARAWAALASGSALGLTALGFTAVFRQGLEAALLYTVLIGYSQRTEWAVIAGAASAGALLIGGGLLVVRLGWRIRPEAFLRVAIPLLMLLSVAFAGGAVAQLQAAGYVPVTSAIKVVPRLPYFIAELTGIHPTYETLGVQLALLIVYAAALVGLRLWRRQSMVERGPTSGPVNAHAEG
jgi:high-affinity iron transporter